MKSLSIVCTQMQLVNSIEAIHYFETTVNDIIIIASTDRVSAIVDLINKYSCSFSFTNIYICAPDHKIGIIRVLKQKMIIDKLLCDTKYDIVFSSNYKQAQQKYVLLKSMAINPNINIVLIDDGLALNEIVVKRNKEIMNNAADVFYISRAYKIVYGGYLKKFIPSHITYFTALEDIAVGGCDNYIKNNFVFLKSQNIGISRFINKNNSCIVIGQPLAENHSLGLSNFSKVQYCKYIKDAVQVLGLQYHKLYYFPHPKENIDNTLTEDFKQTAIIVTPEVPFEIVYLSFPKSTPIIGFYSSVLANLHITSIDPNVNAIYFREIEECSNARIKRVVIECYSYLQRIGINTLNYAKQNSNN